MMIREDCVFYFYRTRNANENFIIPLYCGIISALGELKQIRFKCQVPLKAMPNNNKLLLILAITNH